MGPGMFDGLAEAFFVLSIFAVIGLVALVFGGGWLLWWAFHHIAFV